MNPEEPGGDGIGSEDGSVPGPEEGEAVATGAYPAEADPERMKAVVEAILHVSGQPLSLDRLASVVGTPSRRYIRALVDELNTEYAERGRAFEILEVANGFQVRTRPEFAPWIAKLQPQKPVRLTRAALETLAIIAYKQPATRAEVESIRGVDTGAVLGSLLEKRLVRVLGRKEIAGRPILYGTSQDFLDLFGLKNLASLPTLKEIEGMFETQEDGEAVEGWDAAGSTGVAGASPVTGSGVAADPGDKPHTDARAGVVGGDRDAPDPSDRRQDVVVPGGGPEETVERTRDGSDAQAGVARGVSGEEDHGSEAALGDDEEGWEEEGDLETA